MNEMDYLNAKLVVKGFDEKEVKEISSIIIELLDALKIVNETERKNIILTTLKAF